MELADPSRANNHYMALHTERNLQLRHYFEHMLCEELDPQPGSKEMIDLLIGIIMAELARTTNYETSMTYRVCKYQPDVERMLVYSRNHYARAGLQEMSRLFGYEPSTVSRLIKSYTGKNFKILVNEERMRNACRLLRSSSLSICTVAELVGITNLTCFYRRFHEFRGMTPLEYRKMQQSENELAALSAGSLLSA